MINTCAERMSIAAFSFHRKLLQNARIKMTTISVMAFIPWTTLKKVSFSGNKGEERGFSE